MAATPHPSVSKRTIMLFDAGHPVGSDHNKGSKWRVWRTAQPPDNMQQPRHMCGVARPNCNLTQIYSSPKLLHTRWRYRAPQAQS